MYFEQGEICNPDHSKERSLRGNPEYWEEFAGYNGSLTRGIYVRPDLSQAIEAREQGSNMSSDAGVLKLLDRILQLQIGKTLSTVPTHPKLLSQNIHLLLLCLGSRSYR